ncbi:hypothetical protein BLNAU_10034 [Blattamonas nauphoetae]|uniref:Uncharacterized protein n=1 Tax=Blattamonas nauphoetae TaxID=2049346 RepID=A0ABQ9XUE9_9EUKA|nr:hypothetical protein BLNAU_10034 [Blattamonas nauphoetae]
MSEDAKQPRPSKRFTVRRVRAVLIATIIFSLLILICFIVGLFTVAWPLFGINVVTTMFVVTMYRINIRYKMNCFPRAPILGVLLLVISSILALVASLVTSSKQTLYVSLSAASFAVSVISFILLIVHSAQLLHFIKIVTNPPKTLTTITPQQTDRLLENETRMPTQFTEPEPSTNPQQSEQGMSIAPVDHPDHPNTTPSDLPIADIAMIPTDIPPEGSADLTAPSDEPSSDDEHVPIRITRSVVINPQPIIPFTNTERSTVYTAREVSFIAPDIIKHHSPLSQNLTESRSDRTEPSENDITPRESSALKPTPSLARIQSVVLATAFKGSQKVTIHADHPSEHSESETEERYDAFPVIMGMDEIVRHIQNNSQSPAQQMVLSSEQRSSQPDHSIFVAPSAKTNPQVVDKLLRQNMNDNISLSTNSLSTMWGETDDTIREELVQEEWKRAYGRLGMQQDYPHPTMPGASRVPESADPPTSITPLPSPPSSANSNTTVPRTYSRNVSSIHTSSSKSQLQRINSGFQVFSKHQADQAENEQFETPGPVMTHENSAFTRITSFLPKTSSFVSPSLLVNSNQAHIVALPSKTELVIRRTGSGFTPEFTTVAVLPSTIPESFDMPVDDDDESDSLDGELVDEDYTSTLNVQRPLRSFPSHNTPSFSLITGEDEDADVPLEIPIENPRTPSKLRQSTTE